jgi:hypothetical protein
MAGKIADCGLTETADSELADFAGATAPFSRARSPPYVPAHTSPPLVTATSKT